MCFLFQILVKQRITTDSQCYITGRKKNNLEHKCLNWIGSTTGTNIEHILHLGLVSCLKPD